MTPFPSWLWLLAVLWAGTVVLWQRRVLPADWQRGLGVVAAVYTVLLVGMSAGTAPWTASRGMFWLAGGFAIGGGLLSVRTTSLGARRIGVWLVCCGVAGMLVELGSEMLAGLMLLVGGLAVARIQPVGADVKFAIPHRDAWLVGALATMFVVAWIGGVRYAVTVEMNRPQPSQWITALPSREHIQRWIATERSDVEIASPREYPDPAFWKLLALTGIFISGAILARTTTSQDTPPA